MACRILHFFFYASKYENYLHPQNLYPACKEQIVEATDFVLRNIRLGLTIDGLVFHFPIYCASATSCTPFSSSAGSLPAATFCIATWMAFSNSLLESFLFPAAF